ncbi:hypothetical protein PPROV_000686700 [Pycnococcus provasolii]|uniref:Uncharacterized protein n=1 Tax=Pycnococcus provasolii TaxID=41880 RepID=A0A830HNA9_9CHLO|nr:hypothetical protein PPROV_000686700 [Pycnococcus provasolii]
MMPPSLGLPSSAKVQSHRHLAPCVAPLHGRHGRRSYARIRSIITVPSPSAASSAKHSSSNTNHTNHTNRLVACRASSTEKSSETSSGSSSTRGSNTPPQENNNNNNNQSQPKSPFDGLANSARSLITNVTKSAVPGDASKKQEKAAMAQAAQEAQARARAAAAAAAAASKTTDNGASSTDIAQSPTLPPNLPPATVPRGSREMTTMELQKDVRVLRAALQVSRSDLKQQNARLQTAKEELSMERRKAAQLKASLLESETEVTDLRAQLAESRTFLQSKDRQLEEAYAALSEGAKERGVLRNEIDALEEQLSTSKKEVAEWANELMDLKDIIDGDEERLLSSDSTSSSNIAKTARKEAAIMKEERETWEKLGSPAEVSPAKAVSIERGAMSALKDMVELSRSAAEEARQDISSKLPERAPMNDDVDAREAWAALGLDYDGELDAPVSDEEERAQALEALGSELDGKLEVPLTADEDDEGEDDSGGDTNGADKRQELLDLMSAIESLENGDKSSDKE